MNRLLSHNLWPTVTKLAKKAVKRAAIAYVSSEEYIQFGDGDLLVCDASTNAIKAGQTSAKVLKSAFDRGATVYSLPGLHSKIILLNEKAVIGSANASQSSATDLVEASLLTDQPAIVAHAQSFINQLSSQADLLTTSKLEKLLAIKVERQKRQFGKATTQFRTNTKGYRTWIIATIAMRKDGPEDPDVIESAVEKSKENLSNPRSTVETLRWTGTSRFRNECRKDDWIVQTWRPNGTKRPQWVYPRMPVLDRLEFETATIFLYEQFPNSDKQAVTWSDFKNLVSRAGIKRQVKPNSQFEITESQADSLHAIWKKA
tara:strand:+ start:1243 stop:2190 length:948 start_codon:yes stop_codon:yes gene_type:complete